MPLELIRSDITAMRTDAIVNAANSRLQRGGGVCGAIFARSDGTALQAACDQIGHCSVGDAVLTPSFGLPAPYVIHAVGPVWQGGAHREEELLRSAYTRSLDVAQAHGLHSVAFPLISSGIYGYPKQQALSVAISAVGDWLMAASGDMQVYLVLFDQTAYELGGALYARVRAYIDEQYVSEHTPVGRNAASELLYQQQEMERCSAPAEAASPAAAKHPSARQSAKPSPFHPHPSKTSGKILSEPAPCASLSLEDILSRAGETFPQMLFRLIDERGMSDPEVYKRANIDRKLFSKIRSNPLYQPGKATVLALAVALRLSLDDANELLRRAGFALSPGSRFDLIVEYFIREKQYDIHLINQTLFAFDQKLLGAQ